MPPTTTGYVKVVTRQGGDTPGPSVVFGVSKVFYVDIGFISWFDKC